LESDAENWQIDKEYNQSPLNLDSGNQWLWCTSSQQVKDLLIEAKQQWLQSVEVARLPYDHDTIEEYCSMQMECRTMGKWLLPAIAPPQPNNA
jgi:hypothetical protein